VSNPFSQSIALHLFFAVPEVTVLLFYTFSSAIGGCLFACSCTHLGGAGNEGRGPEVDLLATSFSCRAFLPLRFFFDP